MKKPFIHSATGTTGNMIFEPQGVEAYIAIEHCGERKQTIIDHPVTVEAARLACQERDIETYLAIFRMADEPLKQARAA